jgi:hypothetical protein
MKIPFIHRHHWRPLIDKAYAEYEKQEGQNNRVPNIGRIESCSCWPGIRMVSIVPRLRVVDVDGLP